DKFHLTALAPNPPFDPPRASIRREVRRPPADDSTSEPWCGYSTGLGESTSARTRQCRSLRPSSCSAPGSARWRARGGGGTTASRGPFDTQDALERRACSALEGILGIERA